MKIASRTPNYSKRLFIAGRAQERLRLNSKKQFSPVNRFLPSEADIAQAMRVLSNPEMVKLLKLLSKTIV